MTDEASDASDDSNDDLEEVYEFEVTVDEEGQRLDRILVQRLPGVGRRAATELVRRGDVRVDGRRAVKAEQPAAGAHVTVRLPEPSAAVPDPGPLDVLLERPDLVVVDKPAGQPSAVLRGTDRGTLVNALLARYPEMAGVGFGPREPGIVHRLDTQTSGVLVAARDARTHALIGIMEVYAMHPTVLHEDSRLASGDFPAMGRQYLQAALGAKIPVLHHMGASGNQSPRHCVRGQTFDEAVRLGTILGKAVEKAIGTITFEPHLTLTSAQTFIEYPLRDLPDVESATAKVEAVRAKFARQQQDGTPRAIVRTTECDLFGAEASHALAKSKADGRIDAALKSCMPAEIQLLRIGPWAVVGWQGEVFIEYALAIRQANPGVFVCTCANGSMAGYIATEQAAAEGGYEASTSLFSTESGKRLVAATQRLLDETRP